jgi:hypothetical protein
VRNANAERKNRKKSKEMKMPARMVALLVFSCPPSDKAVQVLKDNFSILLPFLSLSFLYTLSMKVGLSSKECKGRIDDGKGIFIFSTTRTRNHFSPA